MKLDPAALRYLSDDDFRVLTAVEMGMRNHELVPIPLIAAISGLRHGGSMKALKHIHKHKLVHKETKRYIGYRLTSLGYDFLALRALVKRGVLHAIGRPLGVGKEADVFLVAASDALREQLPELQETPHLAMKLHRLGRTSFRAVKSKRDYLVHRKAASWIYLSRLAAMKEYAFMCALHARGFPVPRPLGQSRHVVVMELCEGVPLTQVAQLGDAAKVANELLEVAARLARHGLVHCDLNEFNVMVNEAERVTVIDFPQMVSTSHAEAGELFRRDVDAICRFFVHRYGVAEEELRVPELAEIVAGGGGEEQLDVMVAASGFKNTAGEEGYGVQDREEDDREEGDAGYEGIDLKSLQLAAPDGEAISKDLGVSGNGSEDGDGAPLHEQAQGAVVERSASASMDGDDEGSVQGAGIDRSLIEARVRKQRANQSQRRQLSRRNVVKDSEKRKVKVEMKSRVWE